MSAGSRCDRSSTLHVERLLSLLLSQYLPAINGIAVLIMKTRLYCHWNDLDAFYTFLNCCNQRTSIEVSFTTVNDADDNTCHRLIGNRDILHYIRKYLFPVKEFLPSSRFAIRNANDIKQQIRLLLPILTDAEPRLKEILMMDEKSIARQKGSKHNKYVATTWRSFAHDIRGLELLKEIYLGM